jgi:hypothetical protein
LGKSFGTHLFWNIHFPQPAKSECPQEIRMLRGDTKGKRTRKTRKTRKRKKVKKKKKRRRRKTKKGKRTCQWCCSNDCCRKERVVFG